MCVWINSVNRFISPPGLPVKLWSKELATLNKIIAQGISRSMTQVLVRHQSPELSLSDSCLLENKVQKAKLTSAYLEELWAVLSNAATLQAGLPILA